jgi:hypothetical protein
MYILLSEYSYVGILRTAEKGAATTINAAINPEYAGKEALYFENCKEALPSHRARYSLVICYAFPLINQCY